MTGEQGEGQGVRAHPMEVWPVLALHGTPGRGPCVRVVADCHWRGGQRHVDAQVVVRPVCVWLTAALVARLQHSMRGVQGIPGQRDAAVGQRSTREGHDEGLHGVIGMAAQHTWSTHNGGGIVDGTTGAQQQQQQPLSPTTRATDSSTTPITSPPVDAKAAVDATIHSILDDLRSAQHHQPAAAGGDGSVGGGYKVNSYTTSNTMTAAVEHEKKGEDHKGISYHGGDGTGGTGGVLPLHVQVAVRLPQACVVVAGVGSPSLPPTPSGCDGDGDGRGGSEGDVQEGMYGVDLATVLVLDVYQQLGARQGMVNCVGWVCMICVRDGCV